MSSTNHYLHISKMPRSGPKFQLYKSNIEPDRCIHNHIGYYLPGRKEKSDRNTRKYK